MEGERDLRVNDQGGKREHQGRKTSRVRLKLNGDDILGERAHSRDDGKHHRPSPVEEGYQR
jgi:hypothetical protein